MAPAKINWTLEVLGKRPDGYHEIKSVMQTIDLEDGLELRPASTFSLQIEGREAGILTPRDNLVTQVARAFPKLFDERPVAFTLFKEIPAAAGLGGGSSDAGAALRLLRRYWKLQDQDQLAEVAARHGSDVPFFLRGGVQVATGRGERLTPLPTGAAVVLLLATPPIVLKDKTARLYARLHPRWFSNGERSDALVAKLKTGGTPSTDDYTNVFDAVADDVFPHLGEYRRSFERATGQRALLAGAGPTLFTLHTGSSVWTTGWEIREALQRRGFRVWVAQTLGAAASTRQA